MQFDSQIDKDRRGRQYEVFASQQKKKPVALVSKSFYRLSNNSFDQWEGVLFPFPFGMSFYRRNLRTFLSFFFFQIFSSFFLSNLSSAFLFFPYLSISFFFFSGFFSMEVLFSYRLSSEDFLKLLSLICVCTFFFLSFIFFISLSILFCVPCNIFFLLSFPFIFHFCKSLFFPSESDLDFR